jgi:hypothetical protein
LAFIPQWYHKELPYLCGIIGKGGRVGTKSANGLELFNSTFPEPDFVVDSILPVGLTILSGRPKTGKSWFTLQTALAVSGGEPLLDRFNIPRSGAVLYYALEESDRRTSARLHTLLGAKSPAPLARVHFTYELNTGLTNAISLIEHRLLEVPNVRLIVIDTFLALLKNNGKRDDKDVVRADYGEIDQLRLFAEKHPSIAVVLVCHARKMAADFGLDAVIGTSGITAATDTSFALKRKASGKYLLEITGRDVEEMEFELRFDSSEPFGWKLGAEGAESGLGVVCKEILEALDTYGPMRPIEIAKQLSREPSSVRTHLQTLVRENAVLKTKGKYARFV